MCTRKLTARLKHKQNLHTEAKQNETRMLAINVSIPDLTVAQRCADTTVATSLRYVRRVSKKEILCCGMFFIVSIQQA